MIDAYLLLGENTAAPEATAILQAAAIEPSNHALRQRALAALRAAGDHDRADALDRSRQSTGSEHE